MIDVAVNRVRVCYFHTVDNDDQNEQRMSGTKKLLVECLVSPEGLQILEAGTRVVRETMAWNQFIVANIYAPEPKVCILH